VEVFDVAYHIIGGGEEGGKTLVQTKEDADHSLPYMVAVALLDDQLMPEQYAPERIARPDVQALLRRVAVRPSVDLSRRFPDEHPCRLRIVLRDGSEVRKVKHDYEGFHTRPMDWPTACAKFERLSAPYTDSDRRRAVIEAVTHLDDLRVSDLMAPLSGVSAAGDASATT
jgi:2-methylcitrate dehydratase